MGSDHPEVQEKIRTAMIEGKIADEDFNGDPEYNVLGQRGIRGYARATKSRKTEENDEENDDKVFFQVPAVRLVVTNNGASG